MKATHICSICGSTWRLKNGGWSLVEYRPGSSVRVVISNDILTCCGQVAQSIPLLQVEPPAEKTLLQKILGLFIDEVE